MPSQLSRDFTKQQCTNELQRKHADVHLLIANFSHSDKYSTTRLLPRLVELQGHFRQGERGREGLEIYYSAVNRGQRFTVFQHDNGETLKHQLLSIHGTQISNK